MPVITQIQLDTVQIGPAATFRETINNNFDNIATEFDEVYEVMVDIELSSSQPTTQKTGDIWLKEV